MCTAIAKKGNDVLYGFNLDLDPEVWQYRLILTKKLFSVGITVGSTTYRTHGVTADGGFGCLPYMNGEVFPVPVGVKRERIDLLIDRYLRGKYTFADAERILQEKTLVGIPAATMHSLIGDGDGNMLIAEPGYGWRRVSESWAVLTNYPLLGAPDRRVDPRFLGRERLSAAAAVLEAGGPNFSAPDALEVLRAAKQTGQWGTRVSFVWSKKGNAVFYCLDGDFENVRVHSFA